MVVSSSASLDIVSRPPVRRSEEENLRLSRRRGWALAGYSAALLFVAGMLTAVSDSGEAWRAYGLACLAFGLAVGVGAAILLLRERPGLVQFPARVVGEARRTKAKVGDTFVTRRIDAAERRHAGDRTVGGLPGMAVTQVRVIRAEWTKLYSLRSTAWTLGTAVVLIVGLAVIVGAVVSSQWDTMNPLEQATFRPGTDPLSGIGLAQLAVGVLGVLTTSNEYSTGMIRSTLAAVPRRTPVLWAKLVVLTVVVGVVSLVTIVASFFLAQTLLSGEGLNVGLDEPYVMHVILSGPIYLVIVAIMGMSFGALLRHTAGAISALVGILFLLPLLFALLPGAWFDQATPYLFGAAGQAFWSPPSLGQNQITSAFAAFLVAAAWVGALFAGAVYRLLRDDA